MNNPAGRCDSQCVFCRKFAAGDGRRWYDAEVWSNEHVVAVPGLGSLTAGYLLLLTREHVHSLASASPLLRQELLTAKRLFRTIVQEAYGPVVVFEHGSGPHRGAGSCIDHAHLHIMPNVPGFVQKVRESRELTCIDYEQLESFAGEPYILLEDVDDRVYAARVARLPSQYLRRIVAELLGRPDEWDYALFPGYEQMQMTIDAITPRVNQWRTPVNE